MPTIKIYSKEQVDALISSAGGLPDPSSASAGDVLTLDSNKDPAWSEPDPGLPDATSASAGDVLTLDSNKDPAWATPSSGGGWTDNTFTSWLDLVNFVQSNYDNIKAVAFSGTFFSTSVRALYGCISNRTTTSNTYAFRINFSYEYNYSSSTSSYDNYNALILSIYFLKNTSTGVLSTPKYQTFQNEGARISSENIDVVRIRTASGTAFTPDVGSIHIYT